MDITTGTRLGHYEVSVPIGEGGMGKVYLARDITLQRQVALKCLPEKFTQDKARLQRFEREALAASALNHPNIITVFEIGKEDSTHYLACEYVDGITLREEVEKGQLSLTAIIDICMQVASALAAAHASGVVHRDIKPENIMVRRDGYVKVLDFGLAKLDGREQRSTNASTLLETEPGMIMGTVLYMSPEQARGLEVDEKTDIWSLGVVIYELVSGQPPFKGDTATDVQVQILGSEAPPLTQFVTRVPAELTQILATALAKDPDERYHTAAEMLADLTELKRRLETNPRLGQSTRLKKAKTTAGRLVPNTALRNTSSWQLATGLFASLKWPAVIAGIMALVVAAAVIFKLSQTVVKGKISSVAVLPLRNTDQSTDFYSDGITEGVIDSLSHLKQVRVMAMSTSARYKGKEIDPQKIGKELGVDAIVTGRFAKVDEEFVVSMEMVSSADGARLWGKQFHFRASDLIKIPEEISLSVIQDLRIQLTDDEKGQVTKRYSDNVEAYRYYLQGRSYWNKRTAAGLDEGAKYFQKAIDLDPKYALAYAGLADSYVLMGLYNISPPNTVLPKAKEAANKALELDNSLVEAHVSLARILSEYDWRWQDAEREYVQAIKLNPNYALAHHWYAIHLMARAREDEAATELRLAQQLDPLSFSINASLGLPYYYARQYDQAILQFQKAVNINSELPLAHTLLGQAYAQKGNFGEATAELENALRLDPSPQTKAILGHIYGLSGKKAEAERILEELKQEASQRYIPSYFVAMVCLSLNDKPQALDWLQRAYGERSGWLVMLRVEPRWDALRKEPRFADLERRVGIKS